MSILKEILNIRYYQQYIKPYIQRIKQDGGVWKSETNTQLFYKMCKDYNIIDSIKFAWLGEAGYKHRTSGINTFWTKLYSLVGTNDATQTTSTSQPHIAGNIAPTERIGMKNPNGGVNYMTHPTISFAANEAWSVTTVVNWNKQNNVSACSINDSIILNANLNGTLRFSFGGFDIQVAENTLHRHIGKNAIITTMCKNGAVEFYINGISIPVTRYSGTYVGAKFENINYFSESRSVAGSILSYIIRAQALTPSQVAAESNFLRSLYPEIPSVTIGSQVWATSNCDMVATPMGNLIANVTADANVEKITNGGFDADTNWIKDSTWTISAGIANYNGTVGGTAIRQPVSVVIGNWYKVSITLLNTSPTSSQLVGLSSDGGSSFQTIFANQHRADGIYTTYIKSSKNGLLYILGYNASFSLDNISVQEVGWSDSTNLYDYVYANTTGTVEQKTYAAVKAAAMWSYYNNDTALGAVYGKHYNWYAVKLLQMDIDYYNAANPTTPWGWRVPTDADFNTLATTLGGVSVAGGKMKKDGLLYWAGPNTGADNSSGFSAIPGGRRSNVDGSFININVEGITWQITDNGVNAKRIYMLTSTTTLDNTETSKVRGYSLRLIKN